MIGLFDAKSTEKCENEWNASFEFKQYCCCFVRYVSKSHWEKDWTKMSRTATYLVGTQEPQNTSTLWKY